MTDDNQEMCPHCGKLKAPRLLERAIQLLMDIQLPKKKRDPVWITAGIWMKQGTAQWEYERDQWLRDAGMEQA